MRPVAPVRGSVLQGDPVAAVVSIRSDCAGRGAFGPYGPAASLVLHGAAAAALLLATPPPPAKTARPEPAVEVELVPEPAPARPVTGPSPASPAAPAPSAAPRRERNGAAVAGLPPAPAAAAPATAGGDGSVRAEQVLSGGVLADPRNRKARRALDAMIGEDRIGQLCGIEAMEQVKVRDGRQRPDLVVAYARSETTMDGDALVAPGAAMHIGGSWYALGFRCELTPDHGRVAGFEFALGAAIPRRDWARFGLPTGEAPDD